MASFGVGGAAESYDPAVRDALSLLRIMAERVRGVRPMPDGSTLLSIELTAAEADRLIECGAEAEARGWEGIATVFTPPTPIASPAVTEIVALRWVPRELRALAERIEDLGDLMGGRAAA